LAICAAFWQDQSPTFAIDLQCLASGDRTLAQIAAQFGVSAAHAGRLVIKCYVVVRDTLRVTGMQWVSRPGKR
jgi:hypothetical protein